MVAHAPAEGGALSLFERGTLGAVAGICTTFITHPLDVIRVQMQVAEGTEGAAARGSIGTTMNIVKNQGALGLYEGISAAWLRQVLYGSFRLGVFSYLLDFQKRAAGPDNPPPFWQKVLMGTAAGCIGGVTGNPAELALVRMGADASLPEAERRNYKSSIDCCIRVAREEGPLALWRGVLPTVFRAGTLAGSLMATASELKIKVAAWTGWAQSSVKTLFVATFAASFVANIFSTPFDVVKSRIQQQVGNEYSGMVDCARKSVAREGVGVLWRGFTPAFVKLAPYSIISITLFEKFTVLYTGGKGGAI